MIQSLLLASTLLLSACEHGVSGDILGGKWCDATDSDCHRQRDAYISLRGRAPATGSSSSSSSSSGPAQPRYYVTKRAGIQFPDKKLDRMVNFQGPVFVTTPVY